MQIFWNAPLTTEWSAIWRCIVMLEALNRHHYGLLTMGVNGMQMIRGCLHVPYATKKALQIHLMVPRNGNWRYPAPSQNRRLLAKTSRRNNCLTSVCMKQLELRPSDQAIDSSIHHIRCIFVQVIRLSLLNVMNKSTQVRLIRSSVIRNATMQIILMGHTLIGSPLCTCINLGSQMLQSHWLIIIGSTQTGIGEDETLKNWCYFRSSLEH